MSNSGTGLFDLYGDGIFFQHTLDIEWICVTSPRYPTSDVGSRRQTVMLVASFIKVKLYDHCHRPVKSIKQTNGQARQFCAGSKLTWKMYLIDVSTLFNSFP